MIARPALIEAVIVCVNYSDFLAETLSSNLPQLDSVTVVSDHADRATHALCRRLGVTCLGTDVMYRDRERPAFNKSRAINHALAHISGAGWVLHLDADIALPPMWRKMTLNADLDPTCIYGWDRVDVVGGDQWDAVRSHPTPQYEWGCYVHYPKGCHPGSRCTHGDYAGWLPIGFAQLWSPNGSGIHRYPIKVDSDMEHTDVLHAAQWPRYKRVMLPESILYHLVSPGGNPNEKGTNWHGRKSGPFRPNVAAPLAQAHPGYGYGH